MASLVREERYIFQIGSESYVVRVQEMIWGAEPWPEKCRVQLPASHARAAKNFYRATPRQAAEAAAEYLTSSDSLQEFASCSTARSND